MAVKRVLLLLLNHACFTKFFYDADICTLCSAVLLRLDTAPLFVASSETRIKIRWLWWNNDWITIGAEYQPSDSEDGTELLCGLLLEHNTTSQKTQSDYLQALVAHLKRNMFYNFRVRPLQCDTGGQWTSASASTQAVLIAHDQVCCKILQVSIAKQCNK